MNRSSDQARGLLLTEQGPKSEPQLLGARTQDGDLASYSEKSRIAVSSEEEGLPRLHFEDSVMTGPRRIPSSEITPEETYFNRRSFMKAGAAAASLVATGLAYRRLNRVGSSSVETQQHSGLSSAAAKAEDVA